MYIYTHIYIHTIYIYTIYIYTLYIYSITCKYLYIPIYIFNCICHGMYDKAHPRYAVLARWIVSQRDGQWLGDPRPRHHLIRFLLTMGCLG